MSIAARAAKRTLRIQTAPGSGADPTRAKLIAVAGEVFAERGYYTATVREICLRAGVNIASVNYHFGDKLGLYTEVLRTAVRSVQDAVPAAFGQHARPEDALRAVIKVFIGRLYGSDRPSLPFRLMRHELVQPTPALAQVVDEVMRPNYDRMRGIVGALLGLPADHETTRFCVHSIMGQVVFYPHAAPVLALLWPQFKMTPQRLSKIADHIADFSLAYISRARVSV